MWNWPTLLSAVLTSFACQAVVAAEPSESSQSVPRVVRKDSYFGIHFDLHPNKSDTELGRDVSEENIRGFLRRVRPDFIQYDCVGVPGYSGYPTKIGWPAPGIVKDSLAIWRNVTREEGVALLVHYCVLWNQAAVEHHPDWAAVNALGQSEKEILSIFSPFADQLLIPQLKEAATLYDLDGAWMDADAWIARLDYSPMALAEWKRQTGEEAAPKSREEPRWAEWKMFHRREFEKYLCHYVEALHAHSPKFQIGCNLMYSLIMQGGGWGIYYTPTRTGHIPEQITTTAGEVADFCRARQAVSFQSTTVPQVALLPSAETYWDEADGAAFGRANCREVTKGALDALLESHYSVDILSEHQILPRLQEFPVVVIPDAFKLTDEFRQSLLDYVENGGSLVLLGAQCAKLFERDLGVQFAGGPNQGAELTSADGPSVSWTDGWQQVIIAGAKVISERSVAAGGQSIREPAATVMARGKGRIAAVYGPVAWKYAQERSVAIRDLVGTVMREAFPQPMITVDTKDSVDLAVRRTREGLLCVHFLNLARVQRGEAEFPPMDPYPATGPFTVHLRLSDEPTAVRWEPEGQAIEWSWRDGILTAVVPSVHIHGVLVVDSRLLRAENQSTLPSLLQTATSSGAAEPRPNVLLMVMDDMGYGDLSCHGSPFIKTPNLDSLHADAMRFTDFHVAPMCTPTRGQLLTGCDSLRNGASIVGTSRMMVRAGVPMMPEMFAAAGYATGLFGKWHLGDNHPHRPQDRGWQESLWFPLQEIGSVADYWCNDYFDPVLRRRDGSSEKFAGYCTDIFVEQAITWMRTQHDARKPFLCYLPLNVCHGPQWAPAALREDIARQFPELSPGQIGYLAMLTNADENMGRLERFLIDAELRENTIVLFISDNGGYALVGKYNAGMRDGKSRLAEGGHRVPCFVRWPRQGLAGGRDVSGLTQVQDLLPTLLELSEVPPTAEATFDGISLAPALRGEAPVPQRTLIVQYGIPEPFRMTCVMRGSWRLLSDIKGLAKGEPELYDLSRDPLQRKNLIDQEPAIAAELRAAYDAWWNVTEQLTKQRAFLSLGHEAEPIVTLSSAEWRDNAMGSVVGLRQGVKRRGVWDVEVVRAGRYEISLRRWPEESSLSLGAAAPSWTPRDTATPEHAALAEGVALPIAGAHLRVSDMTQTLSVTGQELAAVFSIDLPAGRSELETFFSDATGKRLCAAFFVTVRRLPDATH